MSYFVSKFNWKASCIIHINQLQESNAYKGYHPVYSVDVLSNSILKRSESFVFLYDLSNVYTQVIILYIVVIENTILKKIGDFVSKLNCQASCILHINQLQQGNVYTRYQSVHNVAISSNNILKNVGECVSKLYSCMICNLCVNQPLS